MNSPESKEPTLIDWVLSSPKRLLERCISFALSFFGVRAQRFIIYSASNLVVVSVLIGLFWAWAPDYWRARILSTVVQHAPVFRTALDDAEAIAVLSSNDPAFAVQEERYQRFYVNVIGRVTEVCTGSFIAASHSTCLDAVASLWAGDTDAAEQALGQLLDAINRQRLPEEEVGSIAHAIKDMGYVAQLIQVRSVMADIDFYRGDFGAAALDLKASNKHAKYLNTLAKTVGSIAAIRSDAWLTETHTLEDPEGFRRARDFLMTNRPEVYQQLSTREFWRMNNFEGASTEALVELGSKIFQNAVENYNSSTAEFSWSAYTYTHALSKKKDWFEIARVFDTYPVLLLESDDHSAWAGHLRVLAEYEYFKNKEFGRSVEILSSAIEGLSLQSDLLSQRGVPHLRRDLATILILEHSGSEEAEKLLLDGQREFAKYFTERSIWYGFNICIRAKNQSLLGNTEEAKQLASWVLDQVNAGKRLDSHFYCGCRMVHAGKNDCEPF